MRKATARSEWIQVPKTVLPKCLCVSTAFIAQAMTSAGEDVEKLEPSSVAVRNVKRCSCFGRLSGGSSSGKHGVAVGSA